MTHMEHSSWLRLRNYWLMTRHDGCWHNDRWRWHMIGRMTDDTRHVTRDTADNWCHCMMIRNGGCWHDDGWQETMDVDSWQLIRNDGCGHDDRWQGTMTRDKWHGTGDTRQVTQNDDRWHGTMTWNKMTHVQNKSVSKWLIIYFY